MRRLAVALAVLASVVTARPALADHAVATRSWTQRAVVIEDRTGVQGARDAARNAVARWNQAGAAFALTYRDGPATNACGPEGNVVSICEAWLDGDASGYTSWYTSEGTTMASAWITLSPPVVRNIGGVNVAGVVAHEIGHAICCGHSAEASIMNPTWSNTSPNVCPVECTGPTAHDFDVLRSVYGVAVAVPTGVRYLTAAGGVADVPGTAAAPVTLHPRNGGTNQQWAIAASGTSYKLTNVASALVLTAMDYPPGSTVAQWPAVRGGSDWQRWAIESAGAGWRLRNLITGLCADTAGASVVVNPCNGSTSQNWSLNA